MQICRSGVVFKVAHINAEPEDRPAQISLCTLFWKFLFGVFLLFISAVSVAVFSVVICSFNIISIPLLGAFSVPAFDGRNVQRLIFPRLWPKIFGVRVAIIPLLSAAGLLLCARMPNQDEDGCVTGGYETQRWPHLRGHAIWPLWLLLAVCVATIFFTIYSEFSTTMLQTGVLVSASAVVALAISCIIWAGWLTVSLISRAETWKLFRAWLRAKKDGVCPIVQVVD